MEDSSKLILADLSIAVLVEEIEGNAKVLLVEQTGAVDSCCDKFTIVYPAIVVGIQLVHQVVPIL